MTTVLNAARACEACHHRLHQGKLTLAVTGVSGHLDQIAQRSMQGKTHLYAALGKTIPLLTVFGYQTATWRKHLVLPKAHDVDALCIATYETGAVVPHHRDRCHRITFRLRRTLRQHHDLPRKGLGRVKYQVNKELEGFRKGDVVRVKGQWIKQINSIYSNGSLAFPWVKGEPFTARPKDCVLLERGTTISWHRMAG